MIKHIYLENACTFQIWIASFIFILLVFIGLISSRKCRRILDMSTSTMLIVSTLIWISGFGLYTLGFHREHLSFPSVVPNAIISSFKMFILNNDITRVSEELKNDNTYMILFTLCHFFAVMMSVMWVAKLIGFRISQYFRYSVYARRKHRKDIVNIFWGINEGSLFLGDSILSHKEESGKRNVVIYVDTKDTSSPDTQKTMTLSNLFDIMKLSKFEQRQIEDMRAYVTVCHYDISEFHDDNINLLKYIKQDKLRKIINSAYRTRIFILSENEDTNIFSALNILQDPILSQKADLTVYAQASSDLKYDIEKLKVIDLSYLAIAQLKIEGKHHPVNNVQIDGATATVTSEFNSMIIGYGNTGKEALKFLYEFASFVNPKGEKAPFTCHVIDKAMDKLEGSIRRQMPAIGDDELKLVKEEIGSAGYWNLIQNTISDMNYVVIAVTDDDLGIKTAIDLYKTALKVRANDLNGFDIYIRCTNSQNYHKMKVLSEQINALNINCGGKIIVFGELSSLYTYDLIIEDDLLKQAKKYHKAYEESNGSACSSAEEAWEHSFGKESITAIQEKNPGCTIMNVADDINRRIAQNFSNSLHRSTKYRLMGLNSENLNDFKAAEKPEVKLKLENLAKCEHIRWESSHKLMGYTYNPRKNLILKHHNCLTPWEDLDEQTKGYDFNVVMTSINIYKN